MKLAIEIAALQTALGESCHQMNQLQSEVAQNAAELQQAVGRYSSVADGAELPGAAVNFDPPAAEPGQRHSKRYRPRDDEPSDDKDPAQAASAEGESPRAPVHTDRDPKSDGPQTPLASRLDADNPPGLAPQDRR
jgi:hypothetical protein